MQSTAFIKLIWDFYGPDASQIAAHHQTHVEQYATMQNQPYYKTGVESQSNEHCLAFVVVEKECMVVWRDALKPHRGQVFKK